MPEGVTIFSPPKSPAVNTSPAVVERNTAPVHDVRAVTGTVSSPTVTPAQERWVAQQDAITRADPWSDPNVVITKDAAGVVTARQRTDGGTNGTPMPDAGAQPQPGQQPAVADGKVRIGELELSEADLRGLMERKSLEESRRAQMPATPGDYSLDLSPDFQYPPGIDGWAFDTQNPTTAALLGAAKEFAHTHGLDQPAFSKLLGLYASHEIAEQGRFAAAKAAELAKLGSNAVGRIDAVTTFLESQVGSDLTKALRLTMHTAKSVEAVERIMRNFTSQGVGGSPGAGRDAAHGQPSRVSDADYARMSYSEKQEYAARFDQRQFNGN
jgi:hypothetical protein